MREKAVILCSGGLDSCVVTAIANESFNLALLHLNYGQLTEIRELKAFEDICSHYKVNQRLVIDTSFLKDIGGSSLTDDKIKIPKAGLKAGVPNTYVPFRNANILAMAVSWAETINATKIFIGAVEEDSSGYPDCRDSFFQSYNKMIKLGTKDTTSIEIVTPLIDKSKKEIVEIGKKLDAPFSKTWSCYSKSELACGLCDSCRLRLSGFSGAGISDPISYQISEK